MKSKIYVWSLLSVIGVGLAATPASAFWWLFHKHHGMCRHSTVIVCRPYNAFTPVCSGNIVCDGCCPLGGLAGHMGGGCDMGACQMGGPVLGHDMAALSGPVGGAPIGVPFGMGGTPHPSSYVGAPMPMPNYYPMHGLPAAPNYAPAFQPNYQPVPVPNTQTYAPMNQTRPVQPANFQQQNPVYYSLYPMQQVPSYWYGN